MGRRLTGASLAPLALPVTLLLALALAGCGGATDGGGVASAGAAAGTGGTSSVAPGGLTDDERNLKFAECLRGRGIDVPDPQPGQDGPRFDFGGGDAEIDREKLRAAVEACAEYAPNGGEPPQLDPEQTEQVRQLAKCMRENGVPDFPDPSADGRIQFGQLDIDPQDPAIRAAFEKCQEFMPNFGDRGGDS